MERIGQFEPRQYFQQMDAVLKQFKGPYIRSSEDCVFRLVQVNPGSKSAC